VKSTCIDLGVFDFRKDCFYVGGVHIPAEARVEIDERLPVHHILKTALAAKSNAIHRTR
jgi:hypothetical protein